MKDYYLGYGEKGNVRLEFDELEDTTLLWQFSSEIIFPDFWLRFTFHVEILNLLIYEPDMLSIKFWPSVANLNCWKSLP